MVPLSELSSPAPRPKAKRYPRARKSDLTTDASDAPTKRTTRTRRSDMDTDASDAPAKVSARARRSDFDTDVSDAPEERANKARDEASGGVLKTKKRQSHTVDRRRRAAPKSCPQSAAPLAQETSMSELSQDRSRQWQEEKWRELEMRVSSRLDTLSDTFAKQMREVQVALIDDIRTLANAMLSALDTRPLFGSASQSVAAELKKPISRQEPRLAPEISDDGLTVSPVQSNVVVPDSGLKVVEPQSSESSSIVQPTTELHRSGALDECETLVEGKSIGVGEGDKPFVQKKIHSRSDVLRDFSSSQVGVPYHQASSSTAEPPVEVQPFTAPVEHKKTSQGSPVYLYSQHLESSSSSPEEARWEWHKGVADTKLDFNEESIRPSVDAKSVSSVMTSAPKVITKTSSLEEIAGSVTVTSHEKPTIASSMQSFKTGRSDCPQYSPSRRASCEIASRQHIESKEDDGHSPHSDFDDLIQELSHPGEQALYAVTADEDDDDNESSDVVDDILADLRKPTTEDTDVEVANPVVTPVLRTESQTAQQSVSITNDVPAFDDGLAHLSSPLKTLGQGEEIKSSEKVSNARAKKEDVVAQELEMCPAFTQELEKCSLSFEEARWQRYDKEIEESVSVSKSGSADNKRRKKEEWWNHMYNKKDDAAAQEQKTLRGQQRAQKSGGSFSKGMSAREGTRAQTASVEEFSLLPCARPRTSRLPVSPNGLCKDLPLVDDVLPPMPNEVTRGRSRSRSEDVTLGTRRRQFF